MKEAIEDDELLQLSALQHIVFCDRQAALIHVEGVWVENYLTLEGNHLHRKADELGGENRRNVLVRRGVSLRSERLGVVGRADVVEFWRTEPPVTGLALDGEPGRWTIVPVEYKRGRPKTHRADEVQLCAQAMCLEEMFGAVIDEGHLFYGRTRRRQNVRFTSGLRDLTMSAARQMRAMVRTRTIPIRPREKKCDHCSLLAVCMPRPAGARAASDYIESFFQTEEGEPP